MQLTTETIYDDGQMLVCVKPFGLSALPDEKGNDDAKTQLELEKGCTLFPVHRLDRTTCGLLVFAKNSRAAAGLSKQFQDGIAQKEYIAAVHGVPEPMGEMEDLLFFDRRKNKSFVVKKPRNGVKKAGLSYRCIQREETSDGPVTYVKIHLKTGRTHQIRVQFASRKFPLVGDRRYGAPDREKQIHLWAAALSLNHPATGKSMHFDLPPEYLPKIPN